MYIAANVPISETGTATAGISVARQLRRNTNTTSTTSSTEMMSVRSTSCSEARMVLVRSTATLIWMSAGIAARNAGNCAITSSMVSMMFAFGCLLMRISTAGSALNRPRLRTSCTESVTLAMSDMRTAAPSLYVTIRFLYGAESSPV